jgi:hypothetical protein
MFYLLRKSDTFEWTTEAQVAFDDLKRILSTSPVLVTPHELEPMLLYIATTNQVVSIVLVIERVEEGKIHGVQCLIYYVTEVLSPAKKRYSHYQKLAYGFFITARRLRHYFQEQPVVVVSEAPLSNILNNPDATGRVSLRGIELYPRDITYEKPKAIKYQILPEFISKWIEVQPPSLPDMSGS